MIRDLDLLVEKIHACRNGCMLYWKDNIDMEYCKFCGDPRHKPIRDRNPRRKKFPYAVLRYLPLTPRLQRLYASPMTVEHMTWHANHVTEEDSICHLSDAEAWRHFERIHPNFALDPVMCTDARSCHESGLHDMCGLWTVNDLSAYGMGSGWSTAGIMGCPICMDDTSAFHLQHGRKVYWDTDEFKAKSATNKVNRVANLVAANTVYHGGSSLVGIHKRKLEAQLGRLPNRMEKTYQKLLEEHVSQPASGEVSSSDGPSSIVQEDQLWAEAAGGRKRG
ncbi:UNVERIFIED_CONTAM: hypothetical protein Sradi_6143500 [Sesamum radiatum]|uniref:Uncharacterized protein n=1 Tax=Sesamum radiatum TaxID=300843 RepID=A0AAW2KJQ9_SESRA